MSKKLLSLFLSVVMVLAICIVPGGVVSAAAADVTPPTIDIESLKVTPQNATLGDVVTFSLSVTDDVKLSSVYLYYKTPTTNKEEYVNLAYNINKGVFTAELKVDNSIESGEWVLYRVVAYDTSENYASIGSIFNYDAKAGLERGNFVISGTNADVLRPEIDLESISVSHKNATVGDTITFSVIATDNVKVSSIGLWYITPETQKSELVQLKYNVSAEKFMGTLNINSTIESGEWKLDHLRVYDSSDNVLSVGLSGYYDIIADLSVGDFCVWGTSADIIPPTVDIKSLSVSTEKVSVGDTVTVSLDVTDNVKISSVYMYYESPVTKASEKLVLKYNVDQDCFAGNFEINDGFESGIWKAKYISVYDSSNNHVTVGNSTAYDIKADLSAGNFTVISSSTNESNVHYDYKITVDETISLQYKSNGNVNWRLSDNTVATITDISSSSIVMGSYMQVVSGCTIVPKKVGVVDVYAVDDNGYLLASAKVLITESTLKKFKITFDVNGGTSTHAPVEVKEGTSITLPIASREGYDFLGWSEVSDATTAEIDYTNPYFPQKDTILYAVWKEKAKFALGDVNNDSKINSSDALLVLKHAVGSINLSDDAKVAADTTKDGKINSSDALRILKFSVGSLTEI